MNERLGAELVRDGTRFGGYNPVSSRVTGNPYRATSNQGRLMGESRYLMLLAGALLLPPRSQAQESVEAAAKLTGITSGMAMACGQDSKPVLHAYRDLLDRKKVLGARRERLVKMVSAASDRGFETQRQPGAMSCAEVKLQMQRAVRRLRRAR